MACTMASCGLCGMCTSAWEHEESDEPTCYIPKFTTNGPDCTQETACGKFIDPRLHSNEPQCPECREWFADFNHIARTA